MFFPCFGLLPPRRKRGFDRAEAGGSLRPNTDPGGNSGLCAAPRCWPQRRDLKFRSFEAISERLKLDASPAAEPHCSRARQEGSPEFGEGRGPSKDQDLSTTRPDLALVQPVGNLGGIIAPLPAHPVCRNAVSTGRSPAASRHGRTSSGAPRGWPRGSGQPLSKNGFSASLACCTERLLGAKVDIRRSRDRRAGLVYPHLRGRLWRGGRLAGPTGALVIAASAVAGFHGKASSVMSG